MEEGRLTTKQIALLAGKLSRTNMETIALSYLNIEKETVDSLNSTYRDTEAFNRIILHRWANQNGGSNQVQKLAEILSKSARDGSYVDPYKVEQILGVLDTETETSLPLKESGNTKSKPYKNKKVKLLAEKLKSSTKDRMKIEVAPWVRDYVTEMDDLYTDLTLEKVNSRLVSKGHDTLSDYKDVFPEPKERRRNMFPCLKSEDDSDGERILFKGDPGMGKTTVSKKTAYDSAVGIFKTFSIVFFVFLKLVKPGDLIENVIIEQTPVLEGLCLKEIQLKHILETFGNKCLLILDGLDEHTGGNNGDVVKIIKRQKFRRCHVLVTSRPHTTKELESYFKLIVQVNGFTYKEAKKFAFQYLRNEDLVEQVLSYNPGYFAESINLSSCPILLSFICLLVRENEIDLSEDNTNNGEIYTRMVRCFYKKFTIRTNTAYQYAEFVKVITAVGKIAFRILLTGNPYFSKSKVIEDAGPHAFDYGLLIGHEDGHKLIRDETADILITFQHRSLQEFLGAFYFIQSLDKRDSIDRLFHNTEPLFMTNPLFLYFCLWFVQHSEAYFTFRNLEHVRHTIQGHILKRINVPNLDLSSIAKKFPAIDIEKMIKQNDIVLSNLLEDILSKCQNVRTLRFENSDSMDGVLVRMRQVLPFINYIAVGDVCVMRRVHNVVIIGTRHDNLTIKSIDEPMAAILLRKHMGFLGANLSIHKESSYASTILQDLSELTCANIKSIHVHERRTKRIKNELRALPLFQHLKHLSFRGIDFVTDEILSLPEASRVGNLPCLTHLSFAHCSSLRNNLSLLFKITWPKLTHLGFEECSLAVKDLKIIGNMQKNCLPNLISMKLSNIDSQSPYKPSLNVILNERFTTLQSLYLNIKTVVRWMKWKPTSNLKVLHLVGNNSLVDTNMLIPDDCLPPCSESLTLQGCVGSLRLLAGYLCRDNLRYLDLSLNKGLKGTLSVILCDNFPSLKNLILQACKLDSQDLSSLAQANVQGRLPNLMHLDISSNTLDTTEYANSLFACCCKWNQLLSLNIMRTFFSPDELHRRVQSGCLSSLQELRISDYPDEVVDVIWSHLQILGTDSLSEVTLCKIADTVGEGKFPALRSVCVEHLAPEAAPPLHKFSAFERLTEANILCHERVVKVHDFMESKCPCQSTFQL